MLGVRMRGPMYAIDGSRGGLRTAERPHRVCYVNKALIVCASRYLIRMGVRAALRSVTGNRLVGPPTIENSVACIDTRIRNAAARASPVRKPAMTHFDYSFGLEEEFFVSRADTGELAVDAARPLVDRARRDLGMTDRKIGRVRAPRYPPVQRAAGAGAPLKCG